MKPDTEIYSLSRKNLYEQVADQLEEQILRQGYADDQKLPSESALSGRFGVSRTVIRESLKLLKERGLIDSRNGMGSYITKPEPETLSDVINRMIVLENIDIGAIYEVRMILETAACRNAALCANPEELAQMEAYLSRMREQDLTVEERRETDFQFHVSIAAASGNKLLEILVQTMKGNLLPVMEKGIYMEGGIEDAIVRHDKIMQALTLHDPDMAEVAMREHIAVSLEQVKKYVRQAGAFRIQ